MRRRAAGSDRREDVTTNEKTPQAGQPYGVKEASSMSSLHHTRPQVNAVQSENPFEVNRRVFASDLDPGAKIVLLVILDHARYGQSKCTASNKTLARESGLSERQTIRHVQNLVDSGWLDLDRLGPLCR